MPQTMFVGVMFILRRTLDMQWVQDLAAKSDNVVLYQIEMPYRCLEALYGKIDEQLKSSGSTKLSCRM